MTVPEEAYDVVVVGAGPAGLATLSALRESYSLDILNDSQIHKMYKSAGRRQQGSTSSKMKRVCVIDPSGSWMTAWKSNFSKLGIQYLRSPAMAHPDAFDQHALLAYSVEKGQKIDLQESGCSSVNRFQSNQYGNASSGLWDMPSTKIFEAFCQDLAERLPHTLVKDSVVDVLEIGDTDSNENGKPKLQVRLGNGKAIRSNAVVLAMGAVGSPVIPKGLQRAPKSRMLHWSDLKSNDSIPKDWKQILVVGGGLTAVQVAQLALGDSSVGGRKVTLCSRRPLVEKFLDIGLDWVDPNSSQKCQSDFYHQPLDERLKVLKQARNGGSVPPYYMNQVEDLEARKKLQRLVGIPNFIYSKEDLGLQFTSTSGKEDCSCCRTEAPLVVGIGSKMHHFDGILIACGTQPNCCQHPLYERLANNKERKLYKGLPMVSEDLEWGNLYIVGAMAGLNLGPDAGNLMGIKRGATIVANHLGVRSWLRDQGNVLANRFALFDSDSDSDSDSDWSDQ